MAEDSSARPPRSWPTNFAPALTPAGGPTDGSTRIGPVPGVVPSAVKVARTDAGSCVRVEGRGTMAQSPFVREFVCQLLQNEGGTVALDLTGCTYLDSTFLGCTLDLHKRFGRNRPPRFTVVASPATAKKLFGATRLDSVLNLSADAPPQIGQWLSLPTESIDAKDVARHVMECHRHLAEIDGPNQAVFARIAEQMANDIKRGQ